MGESGEAGPFLEAEHSRGNDLELVSPNCEKHESGQDSLIATVRCEKSTEEDRGYEMPADDKGARSSWEEQGDGLSQRKATGEVGNTGEARCEVGETVECEVVIEDQVAEEEAGEEGRQPRMARTAQRVSKREREEHDLTHCPSRPWCRNCVRGRG